MMTARKSKIQNAKGQMAIFVALIFQVLFVFFAMAINIGLVVHDKINLQNAVDLAAFYAGQRQAEMLNVIAHTNYQIHQSWKLLNWRYYVLGSLGWAPPKPHPARPGAGYPHAESVWPEIADGPVLCVTHRPVWSSTPGNDNPCQSASFGFPNITIPPIIAGWVPINIIFNGFAKNMQKQIINSCNGFSGYNWFYAASIYIAYMLDQQSRKETIRALARNLARDEKEIIDLNGDKIYDGALKTFKKNLTASNQAAIADFQIYNSLEGLEPKQWLSEMDVWYTMFYQDLVGSAGSCQSKTKSILEEPTNSFTDLLKSFGSGDDKIVKELMTYIQQSRYTPAGNSRRLSLGVEKNPWYLAYMSVKAKTKPRQMFFPFGEPVEFEARAFVQPFGGRVGPWYGKYWARGASQSGGDRTQLAPERLLANGELNMADMKKLIPQYSRFPGDTLGLKSLLAQIGLNALYGIRADMRDYVDITKGFSSTGVNDIVADKVGPESNIRNYEIAAVAPDLFDVAYYSIQPNFGERYLKDLINARERLGIPEIGYPRSDLGSRGQDEKTKYFSVKDQMNVALGINQPSGLLHNPEAYWFIKDRAHLLTSWVHNNHYGDYTTFPSERFGKCLKYDDEFKIKAPGSCLDQGGRAGYSVKLISPEMFTTPLPLGGSGQGPGTILNPPPEGW